MQGLAAGSEVAGYTLEEELFTSRAGPVYRARRLGDGRTVALQIVLPELARNRSSASAS